MDNIEKAVLLVADNINISISREAQVLLVAHLRDLSMGDITPEDIGLIETELASIDFTKVNKHNFDFLLEQNKRRMTIFLMSAILQIDPEVSELNILFCLFRAICERLQFKIEH